MVADFGALGVRSSRDACSFPPSLAMTDSPSGQRPHGIFIVSAPTVWWTLMLRAGSLSYRRSALCRSENVRLCANSIAGPLFFRARNHGLWATVYFFRGQIAPLWKPKLRCQRVTLASKGDECFLRSNGASSKEAAMSKRRSATRSRPEQSEQANRTTRSVTSAEDYSVSLISFDPVQVSDRELEAIELYLGREIDRLLGPVRRPKARGPPN